MLILLLRETLSQLVSVSSAGCSTWTFESGSDGSLIANNSCISQNDDPTAGTSRFSISLIQLVRKPENIILKKKKKNRCRLPNISIFIICPKNNISPFLIVGYYFLLSLTVSIQSLLISWVINVHSQYLWTPKERQCGCKLCFVIVSIYIWTEYEIVKLNGVWQAKRILQATREDG